MLAGWTGRPFVVGGIIGDPLGRLPFIFMVLPLGSRAPCSRPIGDLSEGVRVGKLKFGCECAYDGWSLVSAAYGGIIWDSWMVTLIKEAVFPPGSCGGGVVEARFGA
jgi:hypothetical protein